jgi:multisubunit Na+/H+ antiporter MnhB subunit
MGGKEKEITMNNIVGLAVLALGIVLLIFGFNESHSFSSDVSRTFTGNPTDHSMWLIIGGAAAVIAGIAVSLTGRRRS